MTVDASAVLAILLREPEGMAISETLLTSQEAHAISPVNYLEAAVRLDNHHDRERLQDLDALLKEHRVTIGFVTPEQATIAREAYRNYGKGNHEARLNLGDCFAYALAKARSEPLLFKGDDFRMTDVEAAL